jgi:membrane protease YdiL (CAAX protease family)
MQLLDSSKEIIFWEHMNKSSSDKQVNDKHRDFWFVKHPWFSLITFLVLSVLVLGVIGTLFTQLFDMSPDSRVTGFINTLFSHVIILFVIIPFLLRLPRGSKSFNTYLEDIGLTKVKPTGKLIFLALSCYVILALSQAAGSVVYRITQGAPITLEFIRNVLDITNDLPPNSLSALYSIPSAFEEIGSRGVILTLFLAFYSQRCSIIISSGGFAVLHLLNLLSGREPIWIFGQLGWAFFMGLFYGYLFIKTRSLMPTMLVHYLGNVFVGSFAGYMQNQASIEVQVLYGVTFTFGIIPVTLMVLFVKFYTGKWLGKRVLAGT